MISAVRKRVAARIRAWAFRRLRRVPGPVTILRQKIYIVPTRLGYGFGLLAFVMLMGSMNYSNSLGFALTFLLVSLGLVCMHHTHRNLLGLRVRSGRHEAVFAGQTARFQLIVSNASIASQYAVALDHDALEGEPRFIDIPAGGDAVFWLEMPAPHRGRLAAPAFMLFTEYPLGLFHAWTWIELDMHCIVYPKPADTGLRPPPAHGEGRGHQEGHEGKEDFAGLREYQHGDASRLIHWKALPRTGQLVVKQFADPRQLEVWLDWDSLTGLDEEQRLSQLCRWVLDAHRQGQAYGLRLPGVTHPISAGEMHRHQCLEALALHGEAHG